MFGFCTHAKFVCPDYLFHFVVHFFLRVAKICFFLFFLVASTSGHYSKPNPRCGKGEGEG